MWKKTNVSPSAMNLQDKKENSEVKNPVEGLSQLMDKFHWQVMDLNSTSKTIISNYGSHPETSLSEPSPEPTDSELNIEGVRLD